MNKAKEIQTTQDIVLDVLRHDIAARNSDDCLIMAVCKRLNPLCLNMPFETVLNMRKSLGLPTFETIRRTGQRIRRSYPELAGTDRVEAQRMLNEETFRDYARQVSL